MKKFEKEYELEGKSDGDGYLPDILVCNTTFLPFFEGFCRKLNGTKWALKYTLQFDFSLYIYNIFFPSVLAVKLSTFFTDPDLLKIHWFVVVVLPPHSNPALRTLYTRLIRRPHCHGEFPLSLGPERKSNKGTEGGIERLRINGVFVKWGLTACIIRKVLSF